MEDQETYVSIGRSSLEEVHIDSAQAADDDAAAAKVWAVYVSEAEKYDKALVENWRANMEGMLIFAGLFSASLTAFLIESYKSLNPDAADITVHLLTQISQQLAAAGNGTTAQISEPPPFAPSVALVVCNSLWFISLGLSLACALTATLLEQWARDFLHRADMRSAPLIRARVFSYLYYGLQRFNMHIVVEVIPLLLHASLVLFFAGLVAFLFPINRAMMTIVAVLLLVIVAGYAALTILPLLYLDCPYRTPLSGTFWRVVQYFKQWLIAHRTTTREIRQQQVSMVEEMQRRATVPSAERKARDCRALVWTVKSLTDESELEPFVDAIPDLLWSHPSYGDTGMLDRWKSSYEDHIQNMVRCDETALASRIIALLVSSYSGLMSPDAAKRRQISAYKALWAISTLRNPAPFETFEDARLWFGPLFGPDVDIQHYSISAKALVQHSIYRWNRGQADSILADLINCEADITAGKVPNLDPAKLYVRRITRSSVVGDVQGPATPTKLMDIIRTYCTYTALGIFLMYLQECTLLDRPPYRFWTTKALINIETLNIPPELERDFRTASDKVLTWPFDELTDRIHWIDRLAEELIAFGRDKHLRFEISDIILQIEMKYLSRRTSDEVVGHLFHKSGDVFWSCLPRILADDTDLILRRDPGTFHAYPLEAILTALWRLCAVVCPMSSNIPVYGFKVVEAVASLAPSSLRTSVLLMVKTTILKPYFNLSSSPRELSALYDFRSPILPAETATRIPHEILNQSGQYNLDHIPYWHGVQWEGHICHIAEFLEVCCTSELPYKALRTLRFLCQHIGSLSLSLARLHSKQQRRLGCSIVSLYESTLPGRSQLLEVVVHFGIFLSYHHGDPSFPQYRPWLDDAQARHSIIQAFGRYRSTLSDDKSALAARLDEILHGLEIRHPASGVVESGVVE